MPRRAPESLQIPFDTKTGEMVTYSYSYNGTSEYVTWRENFVFDDAMEYEGFGRGRSAAHFYFKSKTTGRRYQVFMTDMSIILRTKDILHGVVHGTWTFCKRGQNYGLRLATVEGGRGEQAGGDPVRQGNGRAEPKIPTAR